MQILLFMADLTAVNSFTDAVKWSLHWWADKSARIIVHIEQIQNSKMVNKKHQVGKLLLFYQHHKRSRFSPFSIG